MLDDIPCLSDTSVLGIRENFETSNKFILHIIYNLDRMEVNEWFYVYTETYFDVDKSDSTNDITQTILWQGTSINHQLHWDTNDTVFFIKAINFTLSIW